MVASVIFGQPGADHVRIDVLRRGQPEARDYWDGNWLESEVTLVLSPWRGSYRASFRAEEFVEFRRQLSELHGFRTTHAVFEPMEDLWLTLRLEMDQLGHIAMKGKASPGGLVTAIDEVGLHFDVPDFMDQSYLPPIIEQLREIERQFPIVGRP